MAKVTSLSARRHPEIDPELIEIIESMGGEILRAARDECAFSAEVMASQAVHQFAEPEFDPELAAEVKEELGIDLPLEDLPPMTEEQLRDVARSLLAACAAMATPEALAVAIAFARYSGDEEIRAQALALTERIDAGADAGPLAAIGRMRPVKAHRAADVYGDQANVLLEFAGPDGAGEGLMALLDWGRGRGYLKDLFPVASDEIGAVAKDLRDTARASGGLVEVSEVDPAAALGEIAPCLARSREHGDDLPLDEESRFTHLALAARLDDLGIAAEVAPPLTDERIAQAVTEFLASPQGLDLTGGPEGIDAFQAHLWASFIAKYGADDERGRALRIGPWLIEQLLFDAIGEGFEVQPWAAHNIAATVLAWTEWRIAAGGIRGAAAARLLVAAGSLTQEFEDDYPDGDGDE